MHTPAISAINVSRVRIRVSGAVQGVGFRPFMHHLAARYSLAGFVLNDGESVVAEIEGVQLDKFIGELDMQKPTLARIDRIVVTSLPFEGQKGFTIRESVGTERGSARIVPDAATCPSCLGELFDVDSRFHLYAFVTCTQCGPRSTIVHRLPYDRLNTSMAGFAPCGACARDYRDPANRRFHAETIACAVCGPRMSHSIGEIAAALRRGMIVALKGVGAYQLMCDATNEAAVTQLRRRKQRPGKPLAVMAANVASVEYFAAPTVEERKLLGHICRPIVLVRSRMELAPSVAPGMNRVGVMLPSAPVHHLLFHALAGYPAGLVWLDAPHLTSLVATSANIGGQPPIIDELEAKEALVDIADLVVTHDRPILVRMDDSVMAVVDDAPVMIRRSRGLVPEPIDLGEDGPTVLATGAHLKATLCVTRGREAFVSQHLGDLRAADTIRFYQDTARQMMATLGVAPEIVACDLHPDYRSTLFAQSTGLPLLQVQHHAAHIAAVAAEHQMRGRVLGVALDGYGYGDDGAAWGGELILLSGATWKRLGHLAPLAMPGGDRAALEPWRMGVAALTALGRGAEAARRFPGIALASRLASAPDVIGAAVMTTSMGRLFDAAAALLGVNTRQNYEGQAAMELEALVRSAKCLPSGYRIANHVLDFRPLLAGLLEPGLQADEGADVFHGTLIEGLAEWISRTANELGGIEIVLGGGCLTNRVLAEGLAFRLRGLGLNPRLPRAVPANDGGLSLGQAAMARAYLVAGTAASSHAIRR
ncbi:carbamoyltransferase HypF [Bradyrhizobium sp. dw_78]|uniref:carbamoyltransferase HypF n=1 Tax=Bradyrhizobium sp. dw_78 TaxID=2719793 RepID=UPI001BD2A347|nr:carbamoyltransferase HypF [Bradyrhizobium sp. dw_78]